MRPTNPLLRRVRHLKLTTKQGPHNYYKGNRTGSMGEHTKYGGYIVNYDKVRTYVPPSQDKHKRALQPFVSNRIIPIKRRYDKGDGGPIFPPNSGRYYLELWKDKGKDKYHGDDYEIDGTYIGKTEEGR
ncbi:MAG: hypothetical protein M1831_006618 [Alyxoria varia]|nr:MAG: hypothetical protein M1831_006618 [Alyxoria varia]